MARVLTFHIYCSYTYTPHLVHLAEGFTPESDFSLCYCLRLSSYKYRRHYWNYADHLIPTLLSGASSLSLFPILSRSC